MNLKRSSVACLILLNIGISTHAQDEARIFDYWSYYSDVENVLYKHFSQEAFAQLESRKAVIDDLDTKAEWRKRQDDVRNRLQDMAGPFPERTPLNVQVTGTLEKEGFRIEKTVYESAPGYFVTGALYIPENLSGKAPAIFYACGHSVDGFRASIYQHIIINLVKKGFVVFTIDPMGQGERYEYWDVQKNEARCRIPDHEHSFAGAQCLLTGYSTARNFIWDVIRGIDYLLSRPEVDADRIGITGRSGGGNISAYVGALDDRIYAAAPECYITSYEYIFKSIGPQCAEQNLYQMVKGGLDHADFLEVRAPKPTMIISTTRDFFNIQGTRDTYREAKRAFEAFGAPEMLSMVEDDDRHTSTKANREAMYAFFQEQLKNPGSPVDVTVETPAPEELLVTATGQVVSAYSGHSIHSMNRTLAMEKIAEGSVGAIGEAAVRNSGFTYPEDKADAIFSGRFVREDHILERYLVPGSGDYMLPVILVKPAAHAGTQNTLLLHTEGMEHALLHDSLVHELLGRGHNVLLMDLPGIGSMGPGYMKGDSYIQGVSYNQWFTAMLAGGSFVGLRAQDIIRGVHFLESRGAGGPTSAIAIGALGSDLTHAAFFEPGIGRICTVGSLISFQDLVTTRFYDPGFIPFCVPGAVGESDIPELLAGLFPRKVFIINPLSGDGRAAEESLAGSALELPARRYVSEGRAGAFTLRCGVKQEEVYNSLCNWLNE